MALIIGTNCGFVTLEPSGDPEGSTNAIIDYNARATKFTSPAGATKITKVGWYCDNATEEANFEIGIYSADGEVVPGEAGTRLYVTSTNAKGTDAGWKSATVDWNISPETDYWIAVYLDNTATGTNINYEASGGSGFGLSGLPIGWKLPPDLGRMLGVDVELREEGKSLVCC